MGSGGHTVHNTKGPGKPKKYKCQNDGCPLRAICRVSGHGWTGFHCLAHALGVVQHQMFQVTGPGRSSIVIAPLPL